MSVNLTGEKYSGMHKDLKDLEWSERSETKMATLRQDDKRPDPSPLVLTFWREFLKAAVNLSSFVQ